MIGLGSEKRRFLAKMMAITMMLPGYLRGKAYPNRATRYFAHLAKLVF